MSYVYTVKGFFIRGVDKTPIIQSNPNHIVLY